jgi:hypothetical protein
MSTTTTLIFQDIVTQEIKNDEEKLPIAFFELANVDKVGYRLEPHQCRGKASTAKLTTATLTVHQDTSACGNHTGGIVWETSYLLIEYLLSQRAKLGRVLEVGAGCGLLGQVLAASGWCKIVYMTEVKQVLRNLVSNIEQNRHLMKPQKCLAYQLDWLRYEKDAQAANLKAHSLDTILGTDIVFVPSLVEPLLETLRYLAHAKTKVYLCLQIRCPDSHQLLLTKAESYGWTIEHIELDRMAECSWGCKLECHLLKLAVIPNDSRSTVASAPEECRTCDSMRVAKKAKLR